MRLRLLIPFWQALEGFSILINIGLSTRSHVSGIFEIANELIKRGHRIHYAASGYNLGYADGYNFTLHEFESVPFNSLLKISEITKAIQIFRRRSKPLKFKVDTFEAVYYGYKIAYRSIINLALDHQFDLIICDFNANGCRDASEQAKIPMIVGLQSTYSSNLFDVPYLSRHYDSGSTSIESMTITQKVNNLLFKDYEFSKIERASGANINRARLDLGLNLRLNPFQAMNRNLLISTSFIGFEPAFHHPPNLKFVGPIRTSAQPILSEEMQTFLNHHKRVTFVGFGSLSILLPEDIEDILGGLTLLIKRGLIDGAIWGLGKSTYNNSYHPSIKLVNWAPQKTLLNHPHIKLFISHCGFESIMESIDASKPILCNPMFSDQIPNAVKIKEAGIGNFVKRHLSCPEMIFDLALTILNDKNHTIEGNSKRLKILSDHLSQRGVFVGADLIENYINTARACRPFQANNLDIPCEVAHLIPASERMSSIQAQLLDVYFFILSIFILSLVLFFLIIRNADKLVIYNSKSLKLKC